MLISKLEYAMHAYYLWLLLMTIVRLVVGYIELATPVADIRRRRAYGSAITIPSVAASGNRARAGIASTHS